ncbi:MAG: hypothetical protein ABR577_03600 [Pyrinomonadaceae bacterium]
MQETMGRLTEAVDGLKKEQSEQRSKLETIGKQIYAAIAVLTFIGVIIGYFANSINNIVIRQLPTPTAQQQPQSPPATQKP